jgi:hypothetical protein
MILQPAKSTCYLALFTITIVVVLLQIVPSMEHALPGPCDTSDPEICRAVNGCSWCEPNSYTILLDDSRCLPWSQCGGPLHLCELHANESDCISDLHDAGSSAEPSPCAWCSTEHRCVNRTRPPSKPAATGQCIGCDGAFDSGAAADACRVCGGACTGAYLAAADPLRCPCLGCDGRPFSGAAVDACGVCGGDNSSCSGAFTEEQSVGIGLSVSGNILISASLSIQKHAHNLNVAQVAAPPLLRRLSLSLPISQP